MNPSALLWYTYLCFILVHLIQSYDVWVIKLAHNLDLLVHKKHLVLILAQLRLVNHLDSCQTTWFYKTFGKEYLEGTTKK